jgi:hypothetical protein
VFDVAMITANIYADKVHPPYEQGYALPRADNLTEQKEWLILRASQFWPSADMPQYVRNFPVSI